MKLNLWQLNWNEDLSVGIPEIDHDHKNFIRLVNDLNEAIADRMPLEEIRNRMLAILDDASLHFVHEEVLFRQWNYPLTDEHAQRHRDLIHQFHETMAALTPGSSEYTWIEAGLNIKNALIDHMLHEDMKYRDFHHDSQQ
jgi:hemerythrin